MLPHYQVHESQIKVWRRESGLHYHAHMHKQIEMIYVLSGAQDLEIDGLPYRLLGGDLAVIFPDVLHSLAPAEHHGTAEVMMIFNPQILGTFFPDCRQCRPAVPVLRQDQIAPAAAEAARSIWQTDSLTARVGYLYVILGTINDTLKINPIRHTPVQDMTHKLIDYMDGHYTEQLTLDLLAEEFHVSKFYISRIFSEQLKTNFKNYLGALRAEHAAHKIRSTDCSLTVISEQSGFGSQRTFNRVFRELYGMSPREYKHNID